MSDASNATPLRIGLVGCGRLAETGYVPAAAAGAAAVRIVAVADPDRRRRDDVAAAASANGHRVTAFAGTASMVEHGGLDAVVLATPAATHVTDATRAVEAGLPVLVEKPPALDAAAAARLASLGHLVSVGFNRRFDPGALAVRGTAHGRETVIDLELRYRRASWGAYTVRDEVLLDLVPHLVDWARWVSGSEVADVSAGELGHDRVELDLTLARGRATILAAADSLHRERIEVRDRSGSVLARHRVGGLAAAVLGRLRPQHGPHPLTASLTSQLEAFARAARGERDGGLGTATDGVRVMSVIDAARASAADGGRRTTVHDPSEHVPC